MLDVIVFMRVNPSLHFCILDASLRFVESSIGLLIWPTVALAWGVGGKGEGRLGTGNAFTSLDGHGKFSREAELWGGERMPKE